MPARLRMLLGLGFAALAAGGCLLITADAEAGLVVLVAAIIAVLVANPITNPAPAPSRAAGERAPESMREIIEGVADPVLIVADNRVTLANAPARALLGEHIIGEDVRVAIRHPAAAEGLLAPRGPGAPIHLVGLGTRDQRWEMRVSAMAEGRHVVHLIDRTGSYASERMRVDFVANASHELRTPLASLRGYVETLRDDSDADPETRGRFLRIMHDEARRMQHLIDDLISLSRIEAEKYRIPDNSVDLAELIEEVILELSGNPRAGDLVTQIADAPPVTGDPGQLSQVLHNIIGNAMKYGRAGTPVTIAVATEGKNMVRLSVGDEGEGIAPEHLPRLTERFYRVDPGRSRAVGGTGLGLSIVKHIVERHRGRLDIASTLGSGTTVTILLPAVRVS